MMPPLSGLNQRPSALDLLAASDPKAALPALQTLKKSDAIEVSPREVAHIEATARDIFLAMHADDERELDARASFLARRDGTEAPEEFPDIRSDVSEQGSITDLEAQLKADRRNGIISAVASGFLGAAAIAVAVLAVAAVVTGIFAWTAPAFAFLALALASGSALCGINAARLLRGPKETPEEVIPPYTPPIPHENRLYGRYVDHQRYLTEQADARALADSRVLGVQSSFLA